MRKTNRYNMEQLSDAVAMLRKGGLVAVPTETVYGLAADAENSAAIWTLFEVKQREREKAFSILVTGMDMVERYCENIPPVAYALAEKYWPGPLTMILEDKGVVSALVNDEGDTLGVRCPDHPMTQSILQEAPRRRRRSWTISTGTLRASWTAAPAPWAWSPPSWT